MNRIEISEGGIDGLLHSPSSPIARLLEEVADQVVVPDAERTLTQEFVGFRGAFLLGNASAPRPNPPPGPPRYVTGDLYRSIQAVPAQVDNDGLVVYCIAPAAHAKNGSEERYGQKLLDRGYRFLPDHYYSDDQLNGIN